jgi:CheY-like chemotaxis protein
VVDDQPPVLEAVRLLLETKGYQVMAVSRGAEAIRLCREHRGAVAAVVTDMMMPEMDGVATVRALSELDPTLKFIGITGASDPAAIQGIASLNLVAILQKPFTTEALLEALNKALRDRR